MRSVIQRCNWCRVLSEGKVCGEIGKGLVALLGIKQASRLYEHVVRSCRIEGIKVETGNFQTHMQVALENDGPVTLLLDSKKLF